MERKLSVAAGMTTDPELLLVTSPALSVPEFVFFLRLQCHVWEHAPAGNQSLAGTGRVKCNSVRPVS